LSAASPERRRDRILGLAVVVEAVTGLALLVDPALVVRLLLDVEGSGLAALFERLFGISLLALALACWPSPAPHANGVPASRAMLAYNLLIALYLAYVGAVEHLAGWLLWPAVVFHLAVTALLLWTVRGTPRRVASDTSTR
jgi:hypothetical protein